MLELKTPNKELLPLLRTGIDEIKSSPTPFEIYTVKVFLDALERDMASYFDNLEKHSQGLNLDKGFSPESVFWLFDDETFVGFYVLRHKMTDLMIEKGYGQVGYEIIPSKRRQGYAKAGLRLLLNYAKKTFNLNEVVIGCKADNIPSYKTILAMVKEFGGYELKPANSFYEGKKHCIIKL